MRRPWIAATLPEVPGVDIPAYEDDLISRFSNQYIADTLLRLASDGSKKISNAILRPLEEGMASGLPMDHVIMALALWNHFYIHLDEKGNHMPIDDPKCNELLAAASDPVAFFRIAGLSENMLTDGVFICKVKACLSAIDRKGIRRAIAESL